MTEPHAPYLQGFGWNLPVTIVPGGLSRDLEVGSPSCEHLWASGIWITLWGTSVPVLVLGEVRPSWAKLDGAIS